jgi:hypothetical protein
MTADPITLTREQLYELVWSEPTRTVAARYGLSDRGLAKICIRLSVPIPGRGFWAKKAAGHELWRPRLRPLPPSAAPSERQVTVGREVSRRAVAAPDTAARRQATVEKAPDRAIRVSPTLGSPHPLVARTEKSLRNARKDQRGLLLPDAQRILDVRVTRASLDRALRIFDALIKGLETRGFVVSCSPDGERRTSVKVLDEEVGVRIEETVRRVERKPTASLRRREPPGHFLPSYPQYDYIPSGELLLRVTDQDFQATRRTWRDGKRHRLEAQLNRFVVGLVVVAEAKKAERLRLEEFHRELEERRRKAEEQARFRQEEETRIRLLDADLAAWATSRRIREYVAAVQADGRARCETDEQRSDLDRWLEWVNGYAARLDPATRVAPPKQRSPFGL